jgi:hypothetical protein
MPVMSRFVRFSFLILIGLFVTLEGMKIKSVTPIHHLTLMVSSHKGVVPEYPWHALPDRASQALAVSTKGTEVAAATARCGTIVERLSGAAARPIGRRESAAETLGNQLAREDPVHNLSAGSDDRPQFAAVHHLRGTGAGMPDQACDLLYRRAGARHEADE